MSIGSKLLGWVRRQATVDYAEAAEQAVTMNNRGELIINQGMPERAELVRLGQSYFSIGTTIAPVAAVPTTAAHFALYNNEPLGGKCYVIDTIGALVNVSAAAAIVFGPILAINVPASANANPAGSVAIYSLSGRANYRGNGNTKVGVTLGTAPAAGFGAWMPFGQSIVCAASANIGLAQECQVLGKVIVPPQGLFGLATFCSAAGSATALPWLTWHEVQMPLA